MLPYIYLLFILANIIYFICYNKNNIILGYITELFIILFVAGKRYYGGFIAYDLQHYETNYNMHSTISEIGYKVIRNLGIACNIPFYVFYAILTSLCIVLIFHAVRKMSGNVHLFSVAYLIYFILVPIDQLKNLCAFSIYINVFNDLFNPEKKGAIRYAVGTFIAALFHPTFILYELLLLSRLGEKKTFNKCLGGLITFSCIAAILTKSQTIISSTLSGLLAGFNSYERYDKYFLTTSNLAPIAIITVYVVCFLMLLYWSKMYANNEEEHCSCSAEDSNNICYQNSNMLLAIMSLSGCYIPLLFMSMTTYRLIRDIVLVFIAIISTNLKRSFVRNRTVLCLFVVGISIGLFIYDIVIKNYWNDYLIYFFQHEFL